ncbi:MAG: hypothetical protein JW940_11535 [Polyangiaceae bacterium]|nr:hypothetical protein [Polyangiaceae bacterium]
MTEKPNKRTSDKPDSNEEEEARGTDEDEQARATDEDEQDERDDEGSEDEEAEEESGSEAKRESPGLGLFRLRNVLIAAVAVALVASVALTHRREKSERSGEVLDADITLVTADRKDLDCVSSEDVDGYACGYSDEKTARKLDESKKLRPYMTLDRQMYLIPGLFLEPAIAARYQTEPPDNKPREQLRRFTAKCKVTIVDDIDNVRVRWTPSGPWQPSANDVVVATLSQCRVEG